MKQPLKMTDSTLIEKRSRFLAKLIPAISEDEIKNHIDTLKRQHPKASHVCSAFRIGNLTRVTEGFSDDGEPSGTAGMPMLKTLRHHNLINCAILITRYFGGVKLGTGGLQRAYSHTTAQVIAALDESMMESISAKQQLTIQADFQQESLVRHLIQQFDGRLTDISYLANGVNIQVEIDLTKSHALIEQLSARNISNSQ